jgi:tryptophan synthase beta subunit
VAAFEKLEAGVRQHLHSQDFQEQLAAELRNWVGRPHGAVARTRVVEGLGRPKSGSKREDLAHTGAHKINNALGQAPCSPSASA